jgi:TolB protein
LRAAAQVGYFADFLLRMSLDRNGNMLEDRRAAHHNEINNGDPMNKPVSLFVTTLALLVSSTFAHAEPAGQFAAHQDIGAVKRAGAISYDDKLQQYRISASGKNTWFADDQMHYAFNQMGGDFIVRAQVAFEGKGVDPHRKIAWDVRSSLANSAAHVSAAVHGDGLTSLQFREKDGADTDEYRMGIKAPDVIQLERRGDVFIMSAAHFGEPFQVTSVSHLKLGEKVYVGLAVTAHNSDAYETVKASNVRIIVPAAKDFQPYRDYIGSNIEIMDMDTYNRRIVHRSPDSLQAPNWTRDGKALIYNTKGLMYRFDIAGGKPSVIKTGAANNNNNDHVLSWNGKLMGLSSHIKRPDGTNFSTAYTVPIGGSDKATLITDTDQGHSYVHGFTPDDKGLIFTGQRDPAMRANSPKVLNLYAIDIATKKETQLTHTPALDDGAEYTPDGKQIYFNSNRTGLMQLWRMSADGKNQVQLTFDQFNNWFPHVSPDGKKIVFISFQTDIDPYDHPFYRQVYLREMPVEGGEPKVIAYLYGGQGTMNVPSWSPDGKHIAFVSNTKQ